MRSLFGVAPNRIQYGYDYASLEARVQGHFIFPYKDGPALADSLVAEKPNDCFDKLTQILTIKGWINSDEITEETLIANWSADPLHLITYSKPSNIIRRKHIGKMVRVLGDRLDIKVTPNHILVIFNRDLNQYLEIEAKDLKDYVLNNPNTFIPSCGMSTINESQTYSYDVNNIVTTSDKNSGMIVQSYDYETIVKIATKQRLSGSASLIIEKEGEKGIIYQTIIGKAPLNKDGFKVLPSEITIEDVYEDVWCVTVPTHYILVKRNNSIYVSSQCHSINALKLGISRTDAKSFSYACVPVDNTEVLTTEGWKYYNDLSINDSILSYNPELDVIEQDTINDLVYFEDKPIIKMSNSRDSIESTADHRWFGKRRTGHGRTKSKYFVNDFFTTEQVSKDHSILMSAPLVKENSIVTKEEARFLGWLLADGSYSWSPSDRNKKQGVQFSITQSFNKYYKELESDLISVGYDFGIYTKNENSKNPINYYHIHPEKPRELFTRLNIVGIGKHDVDWVSIILSFSKEALDNFVHTFYLSDGHDSNKITQNYGNIHDAISLAFYLQGNRISIVDKEDSCSVITKHSTRYLTGQKLIKESLSSRPTFCLNTNNSTFIIRQNKKLITITGNCMYGASAKKLAKMMSVSDKEGERLYNLYWEAVPALAELKARVEKFWESTGKKYILSIDKRKLFVRSKHSLVNLLFQSTGSLIMKYGTLETAKRLDEKGLLGDPFYDLRDAKKIFSLIIYHDEQQYDMHPDLIPIYKYSTKEEAEANLIVSNNGVSHVGDEYWVAGENILTTTIDESIKYACDNFKLRVPINVEFNIGRCWRRLPLKI